MQAATQKKPPFKMSPCPAEERVCAFYDIPQEYASDVKTGKEGEKTGDDGIHYQKCGGGRRVLKKKLGGG